MSLKILTIFSLLLQSNLAMGAGSKHLLFTPSQGRMRSKIVIPTKTPENFKQPNYFTLIEGNPLPKIWIEQEIQNKENRVHREKAPGTPADK